MVSETEIWLYLFVIGLNGKSSVNFQERTLKELLPFVVPCPAPDIQSAIFVLSGPVSVSMKNNPVLEQIYLPSVDVPDPAPPKMCTTFPAMSAHYLLEFVHKLPEKLQRRIHGLRCAHVDSCDLKQRDGIVASAG